jgi:hypothetical protein
LPGFLQPFGKRCELNEFSVQCGRLHHFEKISAFPHVHPPPMAANFLFNRKILLIPHKYGFEVTFPAEGGDELWGIF